MTKLYCPNGHQIPEPKQEDLKDITVKFYNHKNQRCTQWFLYCVPCDRPYLGCDILGDILNKQEPIPYEFEKILDLKDFVPPLKPASLFFDNSNSVESQPIETCEHEFGWKHFQVKGITGTRHEVVFICEKCEKVKNKIPVSSEGELIVKNLQSHVNDMNAVETKVNPSDMQWVNPKRESQVAIERVIEALDKLSDFYMFNELKNILEEINK